jgi:hypothetical protein
MKIPQLSCLIIAGLSMNACTTQTQTGTSIPPQQSESAVSAEVKPAAAQESAVMLPPAPGIAHRPDVREFINEMSQKHGFSVTELTQAFDQAGFQPSILEAMAKPYEAKPWYAYRKLFLTEKRIKGGRDFMDKNADALAQAKARYGVAPAMVTAIIGVESAYGVKPGKYRLIDYRRSPLIILAGPASSGASLSSSCCSAERRAWTTSRRWAPTRAPWACRNSCPAATASWPRMVMAMANVISGTIRPTPSPA